MLKTTKLELELHAADAQHEKALVETVDTLEAAMLCACVPSNCAKSATEATPLSTGVDVTDDDAMAHILPALLVYAAKPVDVGHDDDNVKMRRSFPTLSGVVPPYMHTRRTTYAKPSPPKMLPEMLHVSVVAASLYWLSRTRTWSPVLKITLAPPSPCEWSGPASVVAGELTFWFTLALEAGGTTTRPGNDEDTSIQSVGHEAPVVNAMALSVCLMEAASAWSGASSRPSGRLRVRLSSSSITRSAGGGIVVRGLP